MKIAIVGAGLTGLSAAFELRDFAKVKVFDDCIGGLASSYCPSYCIEKFYHHCFRGDSDLLDLIKKLKLNSKLVWKVVRIGQECNGRIYPLNTPIEIIKFPCMSLADKIKLAKFTFSCRKKNFDEIKEFDEVKVVEGLKREVGERLLNSFFLPLLKSKFGDYYEEVSYSWLVARVAIRSNRKLRGEELGYLRHGFNQMIERMVEELNSHGVEFEKEKVKKIEKLGNWKVNGEEFDAVIWTAPLPVLKSVNERVYSSAKVKDIKYQSSICLLISSKESVTEDIYWSNVNCRFGAIIEHTHFMPFEDYGENLIYLAGYDRVDGELMSAKEEEVVKIYLKCLKKFGIEEKDVKWTKLFRAKYSGPIYETGYINKITPYRTSVEGLYVAGMTSKPNYPERSMNGSVKAGKEVSKVVRGDFECT